MRPGLVLLAGLVELLGDDRVQLEFAPLGALAPEPPAWKRRTRQAAAGSLGPARA